MSFLHGVLSNIHGHLGLHSYHITTAIDSLDTNKHRGKEGFNAAIRAVVKGVGEYNEGVRRSNQEVKKPIEVLYNYVKDNGAFDTDFNKIQVDKVTSKREDDEVKKAETLVTECLKNAKQFNDALDVSTKDEVKNAIEDLSGNLRDTVLRVRKTVEYETQSLSEMSRREAVVLKATKRRTAEILGHLGKQVNYQIETRVNGLVYGLNVKVARIQKQLEDINRELVEHVNELYKWIEQAESVLQDALSKVDEILKKVEWDDGNEYPRQIRSVVEQIKTSVMVLHSAGEAAREKVEEKVKEALTAVNAMNEAVKDGLGQIKIQVQSVIGEYVYNYVTAVQTKVRQIKGGKSSHDKGLEDIVNAMKAWVQTFTKDGSVKGSFGDKVADWVEYILVYNEFVKGLLKQYVEDLGMEKSKLNDNWDEREEQFSRDGNLQIAETIKIQLKDHGIDDAGQEVQSHIRLESDGTNKIDTYVVAVQAGCQTFARLLGPKIKEEIGVNVNGFVKGIAAKVEESVRSDDVSTSNPNLQSAVQYILHQLVVAAKQTGEELGSFTGDDASKMSANVHAALGVATVLDKDFDKALKKLEPHEYQSAKTFKSGSSATDQIDANIQQTISDALDKQIGPTGADGKVNIPSGKFSTYPTYIVQKNLSAKSILQGKEEEGKLPKAIGEIRTKVTEALTSIEQHKKFADDDLQSVTQKLSMFCGAIKQAAGEDNAEGLKKKLKQLKETYFKTGGTDATSIYKIYKDLSALQSRLAEGPIKDIETFLKDASRLRDETVEYLKEEVKKEIIDAQAKMVTHARKQYVTSIKDMLAAFAQKTTSELTLLPQQIENDRHVGAKGFMKKLHGQFISRIEDFFPKRDVSPDQQKKLKDFADIIRYLFNDFVELLYGQDDFGKSVHKFFEPSRQALHRLLTDLIASQHFDRTFNTNIDNFNTVLHNFAPKQFAGPCSPLLDALNAGLNRLGTELNKAYVSAYDGEKPTDGWVTEVTETSKSSDVASPKYKFTDEGEKCAKVCATLLSTLYTKLSDLRQRCKNGVRNGFNKDTINKTTRLGRFFDGEGFVVSDPDDQNGELQHKKGFTGQNIYAKLITEITGQNSQKYKLVSDDDDQHVDKRQIASGETIPSPKYSVLRDLVGHLHDYFSVNHYATSFSTKHPSSIKDMLQWLAGLPHNHIFTKLPHHVKTLFDRPKEREHEDYSAFQPHELKLDATVPLSAETIIKELGMVCSQSHSVLTSIQGHGHSGGIYACDFYTNSAKLVYPSNPGKCLDLLAEILSRLFHQLNFLYKQCTYPMDLGGWRNCWYGQGVGGSGWQCNEKQCANLECKLTPNQRANLSANQNGNQTCEQHPKCGLKSPLQSFLEDGLQAFLPHRFSQNNCKITCDAPNHRGVPCKTPFGLVDLSTVASHTSSGSRLYRALKELCGTSASPLSRPPQTLGDLFSFYHSFITTWGDKGRKHKKDAFDLAVQKAHFERPYEDLDVYSIFNGSHSAKVAGHGNGDLLSLVCSTQSPGKCGLYLSSLSDHISATFSAKHGDKYLSWIVYMTETFYDLLKKLFDECNGSCGGDRPRCRIAKCPEICKVAKQPTKSHHRDPCKSIVNCNSTLPTLCKYGFTINSPSKMAGKDDPALKRTCHDLCTILEKIVKEGSVLYNLVHKTIPKYLFEIRSKFIWTLLSLWSLSLLYLLHILAVRLDVLKIRSHLRSPSSHRIAAQSLLAAARVKALANVKYFSP
ncbi:hypothetical protein, conserved [Babesia ovata]|uniref:C3H1-type domain-containing protein n=1 Tax=Babesia ovata TaxID=189622 RepID=A0A2H6KJ50_9APIC|nr:uncharacterized protein BOVATA_045160 [Babesia ovata]GBE63023.1 hypothetical protein, conserved [Babesia ovata]